MAAMRLNELLETGTRLTARCEAIAETGSGDRTGPLLAAARLARTNAELAQTLAHLATMERRRRRKIFDPARALRPNLTELNSKKICKDPNAQIKPERRR